MSLIDVLSKRKSTILKRWFDRVIETYPDETARFLKGKQHQFTNPVGHTIFEGIEGIFDGLLRGDDAGQISPFLDNIIRVRAVQDFTASQAVAFIFDLKKAIREEVVKQDLHDLAMADELAVMEARIDGLALASFDVFMKCREKIYDLKANEMRRMTSRMMERFNQLAELKTDKTAVSEEEKQG